MNLSGQEIRITPGEKIARGETCKEGVFWRQVNSETIEEDQVHTDVTGRDKELLLEVVNEYKDLVASTLQELGCTEKMHMSIELNSDRPVYHRPYRLSYHERVQLKDLVSKLKSADVTEDSVSPFASPILLIRKKTGEMRMCVDYQSINKITVKDKYPLPLIDDHIDRLQGQNYFTSLDLFNGYYQIPVEEKARDKTAVVMPDGQYSSSGCLLAYVMLHRSCND